VCCPLPFGTGNDLSRVTGWGGEPDGEIYESMKSLATEICLNSFEKKINVWTVIVKFREGGDTYEVDPRSKDYVPKNETFFERYMINYWGMGEDGRIGVCKSNYFD
jgi:diacylglycerol kinase (ATP)